MSLLLNKQVIHGLGSNIIPRTNNQGSNIIPRTNNQGSNIIPRTNNKGRHPAIGFFRGGRRFHSCNCIPLA